jgi:outer membrane usher protein
MNATARLLLLVAFCVTATLGVFRAETPPEDHRLIVPMVVNLIPKGQYFVVLRGDDVLIRAADLEGAGLRGFEGAREQIAGKEYVSLDSLSPEVSFELDEETFVLRMDASPSLLGEQQIRLSGGAPAGLRYSDDRSTFLNYSINATDIDRIGIFGELGTSIGGKLLYSTFSRRPDGEILRGLSNFTLDRTGSMQRWSFGDASASTDLLGGNVIVGGVSVARNFSLQPYFIRYPSFDFSGVASTPSSVEVYVNGILMERREVAPGEFRLENLPLTAGRGDSHVVVRDSFGRETVHSSSYYASTRLLDPGLSEYNYSIGFRRDAFTTSSFDYGDPLFLGYHRYGLTDRITVGGRIEGSEDLLSGGPILGLLLPLGEIELSLAASGSGGESGGAGSIAYRYLSRRASFGVAMRGMSDGYANLSLDPHQDRRTQEYEAFAGMQLGGGSISARVAMGETIDGTEFSHARLSGNVRLAGKTNLFLSGGHSRTGGVGSNELFAGVSVYFGRNTSANVGLDQRGGAFQQTVEVQKPLSVGEGFGYRVQSRTGDAGESGSASAQYQTSFGRYEVSFDPYNPDRSRSVSASGGLVWIGGGLFASRAVRDSFAVARVGVPDVRVYASNLEIGRTDSRGNLLIPNLLSYYGNRISIEHRDVPFEYEIGAVEKLVAPPYRGGAIIEFPVHRLRTVSGTVVLVDPDGHIIPSYGQIAIEAGDRTIESPLGAAGEFYFENLEAGRHEATIVTSTRECSLVLDIPESPSTFIDLGLIRCGGE